MGKDFICEKNVYIKLSFLIYSLWYILPQFAYNKYYITDTHGPIMSHKDVNDCGSLINHRNQTRPHRYAHTPPTITAA